MKAEKLAQEEISNFGTEYRYGCFVERHGPSCLFLASFLTATRQELHRAYKANKFGCDGLKYGPSCYEVGSDYFLGTYARWHRRPWYAMAFDYFNYGCDTCNHAGSCFRKGQMMIQPKGKYKGVKSNPVEGMKILETACNKGSFDACYEASVHLMTGGLPGVEVDYHKAFLLSKTACEFGFHADACHNLASMYENGIATKKDPITAKKIRDKVSERTAGK